MFYLSIAFFCLLISIPLLLPYLKSGYFPTHDGEWAVVRLADMFREIKDLQIPARMSANLNFNHGYPLFNFAYPFPYYLGLVFYFLGFGFVGAIKIIFALSIPLSAFFMFFASRNIWKNNYAGLVSAVLYVYFPYRLVDLFVRGSIGESIAFVLFPIILLSLSKIVDNPKNRMFILIGGIASGCLVLTHNIMAVLFMITVLIFFIANMIAYRKRIVIQYASVFIIGILLSAFFWLPALIEKKYILLSVVPIAERSQNWVSINQFLFSKWGYGPPTDPINGFSYQIGWPFLIIFFTAAFSILYLVYKKVKLDEFDKLASSLLIGSFLFSLLLFPISSLVWKLPLLKEINFPWIVLSQLSLLIAVVSGYLVLKTTTKYIVIFVITLAVLINIPNAKPSEYFDKGDGYYFTNTGTTTSSSELMPLWVKERPLESPKEKVEILSGKGNISSYNGNSKQFSFAFSASEKSKIRINTIYFPGWKIFVNNEEVKIDYSNNKGLMEINVPKGENQVVGKFENTTIRTIANIISLLAVGGIVIYIVFEISKLVKKKWKK